MWTYWIVDTRTGVKQLQVEPAQNGPYARMIGEGADSSTTFTLTDDSPLHDKALTTQWARSIVRCWNDVPEFVGVIVNRKYDRDKQTLTLQNPDWWTILEGRYPYGALSYWADEPNHIPGRLVCTGKSMRAIMAKVLEQGMIGPYPIYSLPIDLPSTAEGGAFTRTFENFHFRNVPTVLEALAAEDGAPEYDLEPSASAWAAGTLRLTARIGSLAQPQLTAGSFEFHLDAENNPLKNITVEEDGSDQLTGLFGIGQGAEVDMKVGGDGLGGTATIPALDRTKAFKLETSQPILASLASAEVHAHTQPTKQWEMSILASEGPGVDALRLGSLVTVFSYGDPWIDDGPTVLRLISKRCMGGDEIKLDVQPWGG